MPLLLVPGNLPDRHNVSTFIYDGLNRLVQSIAPEGNSVSLTYDAKHNVLTSTASPKPGSSLDDIVETFTYHATYNTVATHEDGRGNITTLTYDSMTGNLLTVEAPEIASQTPTTTMTYNGRGQVLTVEDPTGIVTEFEYDTTTEVLEQVTVDAGMGRLNLITVLDYNAWGDLISVTDPRGNEFTRTFDYKRRVTQVEEASPFNYITNITYDKNDNRLTIERQTGDGGHPWQVFEAEYNIANQVVSIKDPLNNEATKQYDALRRIWKETDPQSRVTEYQYDERGMLKKIIDPNSVEAQVNTYTANGLQSTVEDANGNVTQYVYDGFDRLDKMIYPDGSFEQVDSYDENSNVTEITNRAGDSITFEFDVLNRMIERAPTGMPVVTTAYDLAGRVTSVSTPVVSGDPASGEWEVGYDTAGRAISEEAPDGKTVSYELDENGNVTKITFPDSYYAERVYDELNRLTDIKLNGSSTSAAEFAYDDLSRRTSLTFANGVVTDYGFEWNDNLSSIEHAFTGSDLDFAYAFNNVSELTSQTVSDSQHMWHPAASGTAEFGTANNLNQIPYSTASCGRLFKGYNKNGCLTDDGVWKYEYNNANQLVSAEDGTTTVDYVYDPQNRQIQKNVGGTKTRYAYSGWQRIADYDGTSDTLQNRYVYGVGLDEPLIKVSSGGVLTYFHADSLGSIMAITDNTGAVTNRYKYAPWGESDSMSGTTFGYTGQRYDEETGLYYYKNRYYSPELGRFLQVDPVGGLDQYSYAGNNPMGNTDPYGLTPAGLRDSYITFIHSKLIALADRSRLWGRIEIGAVAAPGHHAYLKGVHIYSPHHSINYSLVRPKDGARNVIQYNTVIIQGLGYTDLLVTHIDNWPHYNKEGVHGFIKADELISNDTKIRFWAITQHEIFLYDPRLGGTTWKWKLNKGTVVGKPEIVPNEFQVSRLPGGSNTVVVNPGCSCKKKPNGPTATPRRNPGVIPNQGITAIGVPMNIPVGLQAVAGSLDMSALSGTITSTSVSGTVIGF